MRVAATSGQVVTLGILIAALAWRVIRWAEQLGTWFHNRGIKNPTAGVNQTVGLNNDPET